MQANSPQASLRKTAMRVASSADTEKGRAVWVQISELRFDRSDVVIAHDCVKWSWEVSCVFPWVQSIESEPTCSHGSSLHTDILHFALHCRGPPCLFLSFFLSVSLFVRFLSSSDLVRHDSPVSVLVHFAFTLHQGIEWASWHGHLSSYAQELKTVCVSGQGLLGATRSHPPDQKSREISQTLFLPHQSVLLPQNSKFLVFAMHGLRCSHTIPHSKSSIEVFLRLAAKRYPQCAGRWKRQWTCVYVMNHHGYDRPQLQQHVRLTSHSFVPAYGWFQKTRSLETFDWP